MGEAGSRDLVRRAGALAVRAPASRSTRTAAFEGRVLGWADLPEVTRRAAAHRSPVVAEQAGVDDSPTWASDGPVQVLRAWRAHRDRIYVATAERRIRAGDRQIVPDGVWRPVSLDRHDADGTPQRRVGRLPAGVDGSPSAGAADDPVAPAALGGPPHHAAGARLWPFLPAAARDGLQQAVPVPEVWLSGLAQTERGDGMPVSQELLVLRQDARTAVVVRATRKVEPVAGAPADRQEMALAAADWLVEQVTFALHQPKQLGATDHTRTLPWR